MLPAYHFEMPREAGLHSRRQHGHAVLVPLAVAHDDLVRGEINVLRAQPRALEQAEPSAVQQEAHQGRLADELCEDGTDLIPGQHDGQSLGALRPDDAVNPGEVLRQE